MSFFLETNTSMSRENSMCSVILLNNDKKPPFEIQYFKTITIVVNTGPVSVNTMLKCSLVQQNIQIRQ